MLKIISSSFIKSAIKKIDYPNLSISEFAFFGRSNAGKSSLINFILNRKALVKVGAMPGKTRMANFFLIEAHMMQKMGETKKVSFTLCDLPGYGYARLNKNEVDSLDSILYEYSTNRKNLKKVFLLMDIRRDVRENEEDTIAFFEKLGIKVVLVATKIDKIAKNEMIKKTKELEHSLIGVKVIPTSTLKGYGKDCLLSSIEEELIEELREEDEE